MSKLQRWILLAALENEGLIPSGQYIAEGFWGKDIVWNRYGERYNAKGIGTGFYKYNSLVNQFSVSTSRARTGLLKKGLIENFPRYGKRAFVLTERGKSQSLIVKARGH